MIKDLKAETRIKGQFLVVTVTKGITNKGSNYLSVLLQDSTGQIDAKKWELLEQDNQIFAEGNIVEIEADVLDYRGTNQLKIIDAKKLDSKDLDVTMFVPNAPVARKAMQDKLFAYIKEIDDEEIQKLVEKIVNDNYLSLSVFPAAAKIHHAYAGGLLHHVTSMLDLARSVAQLYKNVNKNYLYAGIILHDIGKLTELSGPIATKYTLEGKLIGHISIMQAILKNEADKMNIDPTKSIILQHIILSHHGEKEKGSPVMPLTIEAEIIHTLDDLDAKINTISKALENVDEGEFTNRIVTLDDRCFLKTPK